MDVSAYVFVCNGRMGKCFTLFSGYFLGGMVFMLHDTLELLLIHFDSNFVLYRNFVANIEAMFKIP